MAITIKLHAQPLTAPGERGGRLTNPEALQVSNENRQHRPLVLVRLIRLATRSARRRYSAYALRQMAPCDTTFGSDPSRQRNNS
jgi:hypothetical protein